MSLHVEEELPKYDVGNSPKITNFSQMNYQILVAYKLITRFSLKNYQKMRLQELCNVDTTVRASDVGERGNAVIVGDLRVITGSTIRVTGNNNKKRDHKLLEKEPDNIRYKMVVEYQ